MNIFFIVLLPVFTTSMSQMEQKLKKLSQNLDALARTIQTSFVKNGSSLHKLEQKFASALLCAAAGDALGRLTEFNDTIRPSEPCIKYGFNEIETKTHPTKGVIYPYTDDTIMAITILDAACQNQNNKELFIDTVAKNLQRLITDRASDPFFKVRAHGINNIKKLSLPIEEIIKKSTDFSNKSEIQNEGGCGSVMRAWPLGLVFHQPKQHKLLVDWADAQSCLTHRHPMARAACAAIAGGVAAIIRGESPLHVRRHMISIARTYEGEEKHYNKLLINSMVENKKPELCANSLAQNKLTTAQTLEYAGFTQHSPDTILGTNNQKNSNHRSPHGFLLGWAADEAVAAALYIFIRYYNNPIQGLLVAVNTPGDSDSIATLAGALLGAAHPEIIMTKFIPKQLEDYELLKTIWPKKITTILFNHSP